MKCNECGGETPALVLLHETCPACWHAVGQAGRSRIIAAAVLRNPEAWRIKPEKRRHKPAPGDRLSDHLTRDPFFEPAVPLIPDLIVKEPEKG